MPVTVYCAHCNIPKSVKPSYYAQQFTHFFCNMACKGAWQAAHSTRSQNKVQVHCGFCGKSKYVYPCRLNRTRGHFCDLACHGKWQTEAGTVELTCERCGTSYSVPKYFSEERHSRFCSKRCLYDTMSDDMRGDGNPNWKGGHVDITDYGPHWNKIARRIRKRDHHTCQICDKQQRKGLHVHPIRPVRLFNGDLERAHDPLNLITLCQTCHNKVEAGKLNL